RLAWWPSAAAGLFVDLGIRHLRACEYRIGTVSFLSNDRNRRTRHRTVRPAENRGEAPSRTYPDRSRRDRGGGVRAQLPVRRPVPGDDERRIPQGRRHGGGAA